MTNAYLLDMLSGGQGARQGGNVFFEQCGGAVRLNSSLVSQQIHGGLLRVRVYFEGGLVHAVTPFVKSASTTWTKRRKPAQ
jgi:hypothetical protein